MIGRLKVTVMEKNYFVRRCYILTASLFIILLFPKNLNAQGVNCGTATSLIVNGASVGGNITDNTVNDPTISTGCAAGATLRDGWYSFIATATTSTITCISNNRQLVLYAYSGTCGSLSQILCANANTTTGGQTEIMNLTGLAVSNTYFIRVVNSTANNMSINAIRVTTPPANNDCAGAVTLSVNPALTCAATTSGTTTNASQSQTGCLGTADDDVWYKFTATATSHNITVTPGTLSDAVFQVFSGTCGGTLTSLGCVDSTVGSAVETTTLTGLSLGATYFVRVYSYSNGSNQGTFTICATTITPPVNDNCSGAVAMTVNPTSACTTSTSGTTIGGTQSLAGCSGTADDDVWYKFTATGNSHTITVTPGTLGDIVFQVFSGTCAGTLTSMGCTDAVIGAGIETTTLTGLTAGTTYYVRVYSYYSGAGYQGTFSICVTTLAIPTNNNCSGAISLTPSTSCSATAGTTAAATQSQAGCSGTADDDVWYSFIATGTSHIVTVNPGTLYDAVFQVFSGTCAGTLTSLGCTDSTVGVNTETTTLGGLTVGATYFIRIYSYSGSSSYQGTFTVCVTTPTPSSNNCATAAALTVNPTTTCTINTTGTTVGATQSQAGCSGTADDDVWYTFIALGTSHIVTVTPGTMSNVVFQVFSGTCGGTLTSMACVNSTTGANIETKTLTGLTSGTTYYIRIYSSANGSAQGTFSVCVTTPCSIGTGTGITALGCPSVVSGGLGLNGVDPSSIDCLSSGCVNLEATYLQLGQTTNYTVESIAYAPPYQYGCLANAVSIADDDVWSPVINLPFNFCFYGNSYNQCLVSSNGAITFDMTNYTPGGYSNYSFATGVPNATLFKNAIFGVYHDIDPRYGGEVGWELITLNTGCRALVASWSNIPMFSSTCNSLLYTGMMVMYENTNIIDVYIQQKSTCSSWNDGNAIVGLQNAAGTSGISAPNRNGLDANWTVTNEAWRFVPAGPSITSLKWYEGAGTTGPVVGTTDVINVCPTVTTTYTAEISYALCNGTTLKETETTTVTVNGNKIWNGSTGTNWNTSGNWTPSGVPTASDCVVIPNVINDPVISGSAFDAYGYSLKILPGGFLTLSSGNNLTVTNAVNVNTGGNFSIINNASLIQVDNVPNSGTVNMERLTSPVYRFDYTYWNSPVTLGSNYTLGNLSPNTQPDKYYSWTPSISGGTGNWAQESVATIMDPRKGYIVRAPNSFSFTPTVFAPYTANFIGTPNNGDIACPIYYGTLGASSLNDKWNLLGNPYPSAVSAASFLGSANNTSVIDGTIYFWTHNSGINASFPDPFYGDFVLNYTASDYAAWNSTGGTAATTGGSAPNGFIASGQSFFVQSKAVAGSAIFTNAMRVKNNNSQFFRTSGPIAKSDNDNSEDTLEKHLIWLNMTNNTNAFNQLLVGYVENATPGWDRGFDGLHMNDGGLSFYSLIPDMKLVIQGRPLPFNVADEVPLGYESSVSGDYSIRIDHVDGLFQAQDIYLEDQLEQVLHNLKQSPYNFTTEAGIFDNRFILRYTNNTLATGQNTFEASVTAFIKDNSIFVKASENIETIELFDVSGKLVETYKPKESTRDFHDDFRFAQGIYLAKIKLANGISGNKKLIN